MPAKARVKPLCLRKPSYEEAIAAVQRWFQGPDYKKDGPPLELVYFFLRGDHNQVLTLGFRTLHANTDGHQGHISYTDIRSPASFLHNLVLLGQSHVEAEEALECLGRKRFEGSNERWNFSIALRDLLWAGAIHLFFCPACIKGMTPLRELRKQREREKSKQS